jgi:LPXTG-motif cell wall-anchored protein
MIATTLLGRLGQMLAVGLTAAALLVPAATANGGGSFGPHDPWFGYALSLGGTSQSAAQGYRFTTDTLAPGGGKPTQAQGYRFTTDTLAPGGGKPTQAQGYRFTTDTLAPGGGPTAVVVTTDAGFHWGDAGAGAGTAVGALILLTGCALVLVRRRRRVATP